MPVEFLVFFDRYQGVEIPFLLTVDIFHQFWKGNELEYKVVSSFTDLIRTSEKEKTKLE